jgi:hypothetical protein
MNSELGIQTDDGKWISYPVDWSSIKKLKDENEKLKEFIKQKLTNDCAGCDYYNYRPDACSYECNHPEHGCWLEGDGIGCEDHTDLKILD